MKYEKDIAKYLTYFQNLNEKIQLLGTSLQDLIKKTIPPKVIRLLYSVRGGILRKDEEFLDAVIKVGFVYEEMQLDPAI